MLPPAPPPPPQKKNMLMVSLHKGLFKCSVSLYTVHVHVAQVANIHEKPRKQSPTSRGSNIPFLVTMICFGCSSTGRDRIRAATSSAVFHFASCPRRFCPAHTLVWIIFKNSCPVRGLKMKIAPLIGLVVRLPSKV